MPKITAKKAYYDWRVYQEFILENDLEDDSDDITVEDLNEYILNNVDDETYQSLLNYCLKTY